MYQSYESYRAELIAQEVTPLTREQWQREVDGNKPHTVNFTVTPEMAKRGSLEVGQYRNHLGHNHQLIQTVRIA